MIGVRAACLGLAARFHTGVDFWLSLPLDELARWMAEGDRVSREEAE